MNSLKKKKEGQNVGVKCSTQEWMSCYASPFHKMAAESGCYGNILLTPSLHPQAIKITSHITLLHVCLVQQLKQCHNTLWVSRSRSVRLLSAHTQTRLGIHRKLEVGKCFYSWCQDETIHESWQVTVFWISDVTKSSMYSLIVWTMWNFPNGTQHV